MAKFLEFLSVLIVLLYHQNLTLCCHKGVPSQACLWTHCWSLLQTDYWSYGKKGTTLG